MFKFGKKSTKSSIYFPFDTKRIAEGTIPDPLVTIEVKTPQYGFLNIQFLFDSGADITVLPLNPYAALFNYEAKESEAISIQGIGRSVKAYPAKLTCKLNGQTFSIRCYFAATSVLPILGRLDWWDKFSFVLNNNQNRTEFNKLT